MAVQLMTQADYARRRGVSPVAVHKAIKAGRITLIDGKIDPMVADVQWKANTRARISTLRNDGGAANDTPAALPGDTLPPGIDIERISYDEARRRREAAEAQIAERKLAELDGDLVRKSAVTAVWQRRASTFREAILQLPDRLAAQLAAIGDQAKIHALLDAELRQALEHVTGDR